MNSFVPTDADSGTGMTVPRTSPWGCCAQSHLPLSLLGLLHSISTCLWCDWVSSHVPLTAQDFKHFCLSSLNCIFSGVESLVPLHCPSGQCSVHHPSAFPGMFLLRCRVHPELLWAQVHLPSDPNQIYFKADLSCLEEGRGCGVFFCNLSVNTDLFHKMPFIVLKGDHCSLSAIS